MGLPGRGVSGAEGANGETFGKRAEKTAARDLGVGPGSGVCAAWVSARRHDSISFPL